MSRSKNTKEYLLIEFTYFNPNPYKSAWSQLGEIKYYESSPQDFRNAILDAFGISFQTKTKNKMIRSD